MGDTAATHVVTPAASETAFAASQKSGAASKTAVAATTTAGAANQMAWMTPIEIGALNNGTVDERKQNQLEMEQRRDILVATIDAYDQAIAHIKQRPLRIGRFIHLLVVVPSPKVMGDRSCGSTLQEAKKLVFARVQWLT